MWALTDAELFLPESWFTEEKQREWQRLHIPEDRGFQGKIDLAKDQIDHVLTPHLPFEVVGADTFYGRDGEFRDFVASRGKWYMVSIPCHTTVWLTEPVFGIPEKVPGQRGPAAKHESELRCHLAVEPIVVRDCERGVLGYDHAFAEVWTVREEARCDATRKSYKGLRAIKELLHCPSNF